MATGRTVREGAFIQTREPGNQPWTNVKPRRVVRARSDQPLRVLHILRPNSARGVADGVQNMTATRILSGLERSDATGTDADSVARLGFLEWAFGLEGDVTPAVAQAALDSPAAQSAYSEAAKAFVGFLEVAACPTIWVAARRRKRRSLH